MLKTLYVKRPKGREKRKYILLAFDVTYLFIELYSWEIFTNRFSLNMCVRLAPHDQVFLGKIMRNLNTDVREPMDDNLSECFLPIGFTLVLASGGLPSN